jgi:hypothetical protein
MNVNQKLVKRGLLLRLSSKQTTKTDKFSSFNMREESEEGIIKENKSFVKKSCFCCEQIIE